MTDLINKVAIVTGASSGIGRAIAIKLAEHGANVALIARDCAKLKAVREEILEAGGNAEVFACDVSKNENIAACLHDVCACFGTVDILVNNAGTVVFGELDKCTPEVIENCVNTNVLGLINFTRVVLPIMKKNKSGEILNIGSVAATNNWEQWSVYCSSKAAVTAFNESLRKEVGKYNIKAMVINPGTINTDIMENSGYTSNDADLHYGLKPEEVADVAVFMLMQPPRVNLSNVEVWLLGGEI